MILTPKSPTSLQITFLPHFAQMRKRLRWMTGSDDRYYATLRHFKFNHANEIFTLSDAAAVYRALRQAENDERWNRT